MENKLLPIGSVVQIGGPEQTDRADVLIVGYTGTGSGEKIYDYIGFLYPYGFITREEIIVFNSHVIREVLYEGYKDEEYEEAMKVVMKMLQELRGDNNNE